MANESTVDGAQGAFQQPAMSIIHIAFLLFQTSGFLCKPAEIRHRGFLPHLVLYLLATALGSMPDTC